MTSTESMRLRRYLISFASLLLILVMYYGWACFVPNLSDPYYDLGRIYYYSFLIPAGAVGIAFSLSSGVFLYKKASNAELGIYTVLFIFSVVTIVPPLFLAARYLAQPLAMILFQHLK